MALRKEYTYNLLLKRSSSMVVLASYTARAERDAIKYFKGLGHRGIHTIEKVIPVHAVGYESKKARLHKPITL